MKYGTTFSDLWLKNGVFRSHTKDEPSLYGIDKRILPFFSFHQEIIVDHYVLFRRFKVSKYFVNISCKHFYELYSGENLSFKN